MKQPVFRFLVKMAALAMGLVSFLVVDAVLVGALSLWGGLALLPACLFATARLLRLAVRPLRRKKARPVAPAASRPSVVAQPQLQVRAKGQVIHWPAA